MKRHQLTTGFTLLEVIIAVVILAFISLFTARMIQQGVRAKTKIQKEIDRSTALRDALAIMNQDIQLAFNYRDINTELFNAAQEERKKRTQPPPTPDTAGQPGQPPPPPPPNPPAPPNPNQPDYSPKPLKTITQFFGEKNKIDFTSLDNFRALKNLPQSDQAEIGYYLEKCAARLTKNQSSQCLWRRTSPYIDEDIKSGGLKTVLLENVKSLQFRYLGPGHEEEWIETWMTQDGEEVMKGNFPYAVEVSVVVMDKNYDPPREVAMTIVSAVRFPNNKKAPPEGDKTGVVN